MSLSMLAPLHTATARMGNSKQSQEPQMTKTEAIQRIMAIIKTHRRHEGWVRPIEEERIEVERTLTMYLDEELALEVGKLTAPSEENPCRGGCAGCQKCRE